MQSDGEGDHQEIRNGLGHAGLHTEAAQQEGGTVCINSQRPKASYDIVRFDGHVLPLAYSGLVYSRWMRSLRYGNDYFRRIKSDAYFSAYDGYIHRLLHTVGTSVRLAVVSDSHDVVLGFSVGCNNVLHYVHVHKDYRHQGIGRNLIPWGTDTFTHLTKTGDAIWESKFPEWSFNPFV